MLSIDSVVQVRVNVRMDDRRKLRLDLRLATGFVPGQSVNGTVLRERSLGIHRVEDIVLDGPNPIPASLVLPCNVQPNAPVVLYCHGQPGDRGLGRRELLDGSSYLQSPAYGPALANMGFASLAIDMPGFGARQDEAGASLGDCLNDLSRAVGYLWQRSEGGFARVFVLGQSMGAAHAVWLAALDDRIEACAHMCMLADIGPLIEAGAEARLDPSLRVPEVPGMCEMGDVAGLINGPQLICHGGQDPLTPPRARAAAIARVRAAYESTAGVLETFLDPEAGHVESAPMRVAVLDFLARAAKRPAFFA